MKTKHYFIILSIMFAFMGCVSNKATIKNYVNPALNTQQINTVAIFSLRNGFGLNFDPMGMGEKLDINRMFQQEFAKTNPKTKILDSSTSIDLLNQNNLVMSYDSLLRVFEHSGIPNTEILKRIGKQLGSQAIVQGLVRKATQSDGTYGGRRGETSLSIKYVMFSTVSGDVLWEGSYEGYKGTATTLEKAPAIEEVIEVIKKKIPGSIPRLTQ